MCGIAGWSAAPGRGLSPEALGAMGRALAHRGPDGHGEWFDGARGLGLGHRRLSILDLGPTGAQPMVDESGAVLTFNGELYNYRALRVELEALGHSFRSTGDAEVALKALVAWGRDALRRFAGMFALAFVAPGGDRLLLARDPLGIKPLLLAPIPEGRIVLFASEIRSLLASGVVKRRMDHAALGQYLEFGYVFDGRRTILDGVEKLGPGEVVEIEHGTIVARSLYYSLPPMEASATEETREAGLLETLREAVAQHLVADVPVGILLSGGLDSSVIAAIASEHTRVRTLSFGFARSDIDERNYARDVARAIGSDHTEFLIDPEQVVSELGEHADAFDDIVADGAILSTRLAYREARRQGLKVVLVGEGADELFGGYPMFAAALRLRGPAAWRRFLLYRRYASRRFGGQYAEFSRRFGKVAGSDPFAWVEAVRRFELTHQLPNQFVVKVDRASMAESVEARTPYLDRRVVEAAMRFPVRELAVDAERKRPLRRLAERLGSLPRHIVSRTKFGIALAPEWLEREPLLRDLARQHLLARGSIAEVLGFSRLVRTYLERGRNTLALPSPHGLLHHTVWRLLLLSMWSKRVGVAP